MKFFLLIVLSVVLLGCHQAGYQKDRSLRAVHIFGVGWIFEQTGTNKIRVFGIGSIKIANLSSRTQTNAPYTMQETTNHVEP